MARAAKLFREAVVSTQVASAIKALSQGLASDGQQKVALGWIIEFAAGLKFEAFEPSSNDVTQYLLGRQSVARQIVKVIEAPMSEYDKKATNG